MNELVSVRNVRLVPTPPRVCAFLDFSVSRSFFRRLVTNIFDADRTHSSAHCHHNLFNSVHRMTDFTAADKRTVTLSNGVEMPMIGFGTAFGNFNPANGFVGFTPEEGWTHIPQAIQAGYRLFDTALVYNTHQILGISLGREFASGVLTKRSDVFLTSKVFHPPSFVAHNHLKTTLDMRPYLADPSLDIRSRILHDFERSLQELCVGNLDLILMHWPGDFNTTDKEAGDRLRRECWATFEEIYASGRARAIGVSNFEQRHLEPLLETCKVVPMVNQLELHPHRPQRELVEYCKSKNIQPQAWSPFGSGSNQLLTDKELVAIANEVQRDVGQVILRWLIQHNIASLPKTSSPHRMRSNLHDVWDFVLSAENMARIDALGSDDVSYIMKPDSIA